jgi:NADPH-dependent 2,4-dienoyl-CoA reductase/sulfur reductase-like enzyme
MRDRDVVIIGGGPAGLSAARRLAELGIRNVTVLEREAEAGGVPRHCGHLGFGWQSHRRIWSGPHFAAAMRSSVDGLDIRTGTTVLQIGKDGVLRIRDRSGLGEIAARRIMIATGTRETPRAPRFAGGSRPQGVMTTGALQQHVYLQGFRPFKAPVIVGTEWVSFSAILTCRHLGIRPVAMIEAQARTSAPWPGGPIARLIYGVPVLLNSRILEIRGKQQVEAVTIETQGQRRDLPCDGVIFTGQFVPERAVFAEGPTIFTAGNVNAPLKTSGQCWHEGRAVAENIARSLA